MKKLLSLLLFLPLCLHVVVAQEVDSHATLLDNYIDEHPQTVRVNFIYEGCNLSVSADSSNLFVQLFITNPMLQMRLLMQECFLFIDPTGKRKEKYAIILPSAKYVKGYTGDAIPRPTSSDQRPDLSGLITMLNLYGAEWDINGRTTRLHPDRFKIVFDAEQEALIYTVLASRNAFYKEKNTVDEWCFGIYSPIDGGAPSPNGPMPDRNDRPADRESNAMEDDAKLRQFLSKAIRQWVSISIKDIENANAIMPQSLSDSESSLDENQFNVSLSTLSDTLSVVVSVNDMMTSQCFIMQGLQLCLTDETNDSIQIEFPSAHDVKDRVRHHPDEVAPTMQNGKKPSRPDIRYLLSEMNDTTIVIHGSGVEPLSHEIIAQPENGSVVFKVQMLAHGFKADGTVKVSISSAPSEEMMQNPEFERDGAGTTNSPHTPDMEAKKFKVIRETFYINLPNAQ